MTRRKLAPRATISILAAILLIVTAAGYATGRLDSPISNTSAAGPVPQMADANSPPSLPQLLSGIGPQAQPAAVSPNLSYYFISGNTFTPYSGTSTSYFRQATGCVNQMPLGHPFSAPVNLPQGSQVVSITLFTYDTVATTTVSSAYFILSDSMGLAGYTVSASSRPSISGYQQNQSTQNNPFTVDNEHYNYLVEWRTFGSIDSAYLSLCGVRVAYYAPMGSTYLPLILKNQAGQ